MTWKTDSEGVVQYDDSFYWKLALPAVTIALHLAVGAVFIGLTLARAPMAVPSVIGLLVLGFIAWTLFEYAVHRFLFHQTGHPALVWIYKHGHMPHHRAQRMEDDNHRALHPAIGIPALLPHYLIALAAGSATYAALAVGFMVGYCAYELLHYLFHGTDFPARHADVGFIHRRFLAHRVHHFVNAQRNHGFTLLVWDWLFGTLDLNDTSLIRAQRRGERDRTRYAPTGLPPQLHPSRAERDTAEGAAAA